MEAPPGGIPLEIWSDEVKMRAMFAPFREKTLNPLGWESKMQFWRNAIENWCLKSGRPVFRSADLREAFRRQGKLPACIDTVVDFMLRNGSLKRSTDIRKQDSLAYRGLLLALRPASWTLNKLVSTVWTPKPEDLSCVPVVHPPTLQRESASMLNSVPDKHKLGRTSRLREIFSKYDNNAFEILLTQLEIDRFIALSEDRSIYKFAQSENDRVQPLNETESCLIRLAEARQYLETIADDLKIKIIDSEQSARSHIKTARPLAAHHLKLKKRFEDRLTKVVNSLENIIVLSETIEQTRTDAEVLAAYNEGLAGLKGSMRQGRLDEKGVTDLMDDLKDAFDEYNNIQETLAQPMSPNPDDLELEEELKGLTIDDDDSGDLPSPPTNELGSKDNPKKIPVLN